MHVALNSLTLLLASLLMRLLLKTWWTVGLTCLGILLLKQLGTLLIMLQRRSFLSMLLVKRLRVRQAGSVKAWVNSLGRVPLMTTLCMLGTRNTVELPLALLVIIILLVPTLSLLTS